MHGGLFSSDDVTLDDIRGVDRNRQPPESGSLPLKFLTFWGGKCNICSTFVVHMHKT